MLFSCTSTYLGVAGVEVQHVMILVLLLDTKPDEQRPVWTPPLIIFSCFVERMSPACTVGLSCKYQVMEKLKQSDHTASVNGLPNQWFEQQGLANTGGQDIRYPLLLICSADCKLQYIDNCNTTDIG